MGWVQGSWHGVTEVGSSTWLAWAAWAALALGVVALVFTNAQIKRNRRLAAEQTRPHVGMLMEPHAADWHVIELVVRNFGQTAAYDIRFSFPTPPTVAEYENAADGYANIVELKLPAELPVLAPGQEWRMVWDSALDRAEIGNGIESRFTGSVHYHDRPEQPRGWRFWKGERPLLETKVVLDWNALPPVQRIELMTNHDLAKEGKAEAGAAAQPADLLPLRKQGNTARRFPQRDRSHQPRRGRNSGQMAHPPARRTHRRQPAVG